jgi:aminodeoxyfutalosine deaminase
MGPSAVTRAGGVSTREFRASWVVPISGPPIRDGWIRTEGERIVAVGPPRQSGGAVQQIDLGPVAVLPGLVNAHTHLELSWMRGLLPRTDDFPGWIRSVIALQRSPGDSKAADNAVVEAIAEAESTGTVLFGDISNTLSSVPRLIESGSNAVVFHELIGFVGARASALIQAGLDTLQALPKGGSLHYGFAAHAPYSVSPQLFRSIAQQRDADNRSTCSVHLGESAAEIEFLRDGEGPWRSLLEDLGVWDPSWVPPACGPVQYLERLEFLNDRTLVVHGVHLAVEELRRLHRVGATLVTCPRGNRLTGAGQPPVADFYREGLRVALGTDSLASVPDLNLFNELAELRRIAPEIPAAVLLESATITGARALGFERELGTLEPGKRARLLSVAVPSELDDPLEYLVGGVSSERIRWVHT